MKDNETNMKSIQITNLVDISMYVIFPHIFSSRRVTPRTPEASTEELPKCSSSGAIAGVPRLAPPPSPAYKASFES